MEYERKRNRQDGREFSRTVIGGGRAKAKHTGFRIAVWIVVGVLLAGGGFFAALHKSNDEADENPVRIKERMQKRATARTLSHPPTNRSAKTMAREAKPDIDIREIRRKISAIPLREREDLAFEEMERKPIDLAPKTNRIFRTGVEASMARIFMTRLGDPPPPPFTTAIPLRDEAHLAEILVADNPALESDTEEQREAKETVELAKKEMSDYIKAGGDPGDFLAYYRGKLQDAFETRRESAKAFMQVLREEPDIAGEYLEQLNDRLAEKGIRTIELTEKQKQRMGIE